MVRCGALRAGLSGARTRASRPGLSVSVPGGCVSPECEARGNGGSFSPPCVLTAERVAQCVRKSGRRDGRRRETRTRAAGGSPHLRAPAAASDNLPPAKRALRGPRAVRGDPCARVLPAACAPEA